MLDKFITGASENCGRFSDPVVDKLFEQQKVELDEQKRIELVKEMQKALIEKTWWIPGLWWTRVRCARRSIRNYEPHAQPLDEPAP